MRRHPEEHESADSAGEGMWPVDVALVALGGLVAYVIGSRLSFSHPNLLHNAWTYIGLLAVGVVVSACVLRFLAGRLLRRSVEIGFLVSILVHLLLLLAAVNIVIFSRYWPDPFTGAKEDRSPVRRTVPEHLFLQQNQDAHQPDWAKPVDVQTASRVQPQELLELPPLEKTAAQLEMPTEQPPTETELQKQLLQRRETEEAVPAPENSPSKLARREVERRREVDASIDVPNVVPAPQAANAIQQHQVAPLQRSAPASSAALEMPNHAPQVQPSTPRPELELRRNEELPRVGMASAPTPRLRQQRSANPVTPAGAAPTVPTYQVARMEPEASHLLKRETSRNSRANEMAENSLADLGQTGPTWVPSPAEAAAIGVPLERSVAGLSGVPHVREGQAVSPIGRSRTSRTNAPSLPTGPPNLSGLEGSVAGSGGQQSSADAPAMNQGEGLSRRAVQSDTVAALGRDGGGNPSPLIVNADIGPAGLAATPATRAGLAAIADPDPAAALDLGRRPTRRKVGGPIKPAGTQVASAESFQRRVLRTSGSAAPAAAGMVGPQTEEAIELALEFLAKLQLPEGHWSLEQPGESTLLRSDTAATGLCLLSFQGAGYTHRQHQYAATVAKGIDHLLRHQKSDGDLFKPEDATSNQNVWLYSHAIAALALCEAYGMTQDPKLKDPAQRSLDFIVASQNPQRGGWRYRPGVSSDTSVSGWMMMALKSGELAGLEVPQSTYNLVDRWLQAAQQGVGQADRYRYNPYAPMNELQRHGRQVTRTMTAVGLLMRMYGGMHREDQAMISGADYLAQSLPAIGTPQQPRRDTYYWYYATQVMFHMGGEHWERWNRALIPTLIDNQIREGEQAGSWEPGGEVPDRWSPHGGRLYLTTMNLLSLEVFYRHLPIYEETAR